jgi:hypothetical protein
MMISNFCHIFSIKNICRRHDGAIVILAKRKSIYSPQNVELDTIVLIGIYSYSDLPILQLLFRLNIFNLNQSCSVVAIDD